MPHPIDPLNESGPGRKERVLGLSALLTGLAAFHGWGWCVLLYPGLLSWALAGTPPRRRIALAAAWGFLFSMAFYHWVGAYGVLPWMALSLVRGLPWSLYCLPVLFLMRCKGKLTQDPLTRFGALEVVGGALGLGLVSWVLLLGTTGVDWETPAGALTSWPHLLSPLRWVGLPVVAAALGGLSHLLLSRVARLTAFGVVLLGIWVFGAPSLAGAAASVSGLRVALLQTGFSQDEKWDQAHRTRSADMLLEKTEEAARQGAHLVIWPETAWPYRGLRRRVSQTRRIGKLARRLGVDIVVTSIEEPEPNVWRNSVSLVLASGRFSQLYEKRRLAPFAEYLPAPQAWQAGLRRLGPLSRISYFAPAAAPTVLSASGGLRFAILICYESMTPAMAAEMAGKVDFLVVVTNDAPFDHAQANEAHFRSAILRAIETGRPVLQAANTGVTGAIAGDGTVLMRTGEGISGPSVQYLLP